MKCKLCGHELGEQPTETLKIKELKLEVTKVLQKNITFKDIVIPRGWDIPNLDQGVKLLNTPKFREFINWESAENDFWIHQPFEENKKRGFVCRLFRSRDGRLDAGSGGLLGSGASGRGASYRGVLLVRKIWTEEDVK